METASRKSSGPPKMTILVDTREQVPFRFSDKVETRRAALNVGDYSLPGLEESVTIERKSLSDLLGCIGRDRDRFVRELRQLRAFRFSALVIESRWSTIMSGIYGVPSQIHPESVIGSLCAFAIKYGVVPILAEDHEAGARITEALLRNYLRILKREYEKSTEEAKQECAV